MEKVFYSMKAVWEVPGLNFTEIKYVIQNEPIRHISTRWHHLLHCGYLGITNFFYMDKCKKNVSKM